MHSGAFLIIIGLLTLFLYFFLQKRRKHSLTNQNNHNIKQPTTLKMASSLRNKQGWITLRGPALNDQLRLPSVHQADLPKLYIYFGSQTGTAEGFANSLYSEANAKGFESTVIDLEDFSEEALLKQKVAVFIVATFGEGQPTSNAQDFHDWLKKRKKERQTSLLAGIKFSVFGLGSSHYEHFCAAGKYFDSHLQTLGGNRIMDLHEGDSAKNIETDFEKWRNDFWAKLGKLYHNNMENSPNKTQDKRTKPLLKVVLVGDSDPALEETKQAPQLRISEAVQQKLLETKSKIETTYDLSSRQFFNGHDFQVESVDQLRKNQDFGSTLLIRLKSPVQYHTADDLALFPQNSLENVLSIAERLKVEASLDSKVFFELQGSAVPKRLKLPFHGGYTLREAFTRFCDISGPLNPRILNELSEMAQNAEEKQKLAELAALGLKKDATVAKENDFHKLTENRCSLLNILQEFKSIDISLDKFFSLVPRIMPRYYTIASSNLALPDSVEIAISLTSLKLPSGQMWEGLTSHFLNKIYKQKDLGKIIRGFIKKSDFRLPKEVYETDSTEIPNVIMVGPGTGVAPFRGFLQDIEETKKKAVFPYQLYFGCKRRDSDFIFEDELRQHFQNTEADLVLAFSREGVQKQYVQHILAEREDFVKSHIFDKNGYMYLCGSTQMGKETQSLIQKIIGEALPDPEQAQAFWKNLEKSGRFVKELWG